MYLKDENKMKKWPVMANFFNKTNTLEYFN